MDSELDSALDSGFDSDSALELPDVLDDADEELLVLWEELLPELPEELPEDEGVDELPLSPQDASERAMPAASREQSVRFSVRFFMGLPP